MGFGLELRRITALPTLNYNVIDRFITDPQNNMVVRTVRTLTKPLTTPPPDFHTTYTPSPYSTYTNFHSHTTTFTHPFTLTHDNNTTKHSRSHRFGDRQPSSTTITTLFTDDLHTDPPHISRLEIDLPHPKVGYIT